MKREVFGARARGVALGIGLALCFVAVGAGLVLAVQRADMYPQSAVPMSTPSAMEKTPGAESTLAATPTAESRVTTLRVTTTVSSSALLISFRVRQMPGDYLFDVPVLVVGQSRLEPSPASLEAAKFALLKVVTAGSAEASLSFVDVPSGETKGKLIFNPNGEAESRINPKIEVEVSWLPEATATPKR